MQALRRASLALSFVLLASCGDGSTGPGSGSNSIIVTPNTLTLYVGGIHDLTARAVDSNGRGLSPQPTITWSSSSGNVATVVTTTGRVTAVAVGATTITATGGGMSGNATLTVIVKPVASVTLSPGIVTITPNTPTPIQAILRAADGEVLTGRSCTWTATDAAVLTVTSSGATRRP